MEQCRVTARRRTSISIKEREAILRALSEMPDDPHSVAQRFGRGITTIMKMKAYAAVSGSTRRDELRKRAAEQVQALRDQWR